MNRFLTWKIVSFNRFYNHFQPFFLYFLIAKCRNISNRPFSFFYIVSPFSTVSDRFRPYWQECSCGWRTAVGWRLGGRSVSENPWAGRAPSRRRRPPPLLPQTFLSHRRPPRLTSSSPHAGHTLGRPPTSTPPAMAITAPTPDILGEHQSGQDVRTQNGNCSHPSLATRFHGACGGLWDLVARVAIWLRTGLVTVFACLIALIAVMACGAVANIVKPSLGPVGLDKVCVPSTLIYI
jgi:hypothetical protein